MDIKNLNINMKNVLKLIAGLGLTGVIILSANQVGQSIVPDNQDKSQDQRVEEVVESIGLGLEESFRIGFEASPDLVREFSEVYPKIAEFLKLYEDYFEPKDVVDAINSLNVADMTNNHNDDSLLAYYDCNTNTIYLSEKLTYKKASQVIEIKEHEFFHFLFGKGFSGGRFKINHTGHALDEGVATLLTQESGDFDDTVHYRKNANYVRVICELIGSKNFLSAYISEDINELYNYLSEYISKSDAKKLVRYIDEACQDYGNQITDADKEAWKIIESIYIEKNGISIKDSDDYIMKMYSNKMYKTAYSIEGANSYADIEIRKNYFLNLGTPKIVFVKDGIEYGEIICAYSERDFSPIQTNGESQTK